MTTERDRCLDLLVEGMLGGVTFHHDIPDDRIDGIKAAMRETADSFLSVWDDSKARGGRLIVDQTWERTTAAGTELYQWVKGRAAEPGESADGLREYAPPIGTGCAHHARDIGEPCNVCGKIKADPHG